MCINIFAHCGKLWFCRCFFPFLPCKPPFSTNRLLLRLFFVPQVCGSVPVFSDRVGFFASERFRFSTAFHRFSLGFPLFFAFANALQSRIKSRLARLSTVSAGYSAFSSEKYILFILFFYCAARKKKEDRISVRAEREKKVVGRCPTPYQLLKKLDQNFSCF